MIAALLPEYPELSAERCCRACGIARSTLYRKPVVAGDGEIVEAIQTLLVQFPRYGYRRVAAALGLTAKRARTLMRRHRLSSNRPRRRRSSTIPGVWKGGANLLKGRVPGQAGEVLAADVTAIPLVGGRWGYLAVVLDSFTRQVVGWSVSARNDTGLTRDCLLMALATVRVRQDWIHHSDRGSNYVSHDYRDLVIRNGGSPSYSDPARPTQNARVESFFKTFKLEEAGCDLYGDLEEAREAFADYFKLYNSKRLHSSLGMKTPDQFSKEHAILQ